MPGQRYALRLTDTTENRYIKEAARHVAEWVQLTHYRSNVYNLTGTFYRQVFFNEDGRWRDWAVSKLLYELLDRHGLRAKLLVIVKSDRALVYVRIKERR